MSEKKKSKAQPFASYLRSNEQILWQSKSSVTTWDTVRPAIQAALLALVSIPLFVLSAVMTISNDLDSSLVALWLVLFIIMGVVTRFTRVSSVRSRLSAVDSSQPAFYAVTTERLFFNQSDNIDALPLEKLSDINILPDGTLNFGPVFPMWSGLEDAEHVKSIIEQAQKEQGKTQLP